MNKMVRKRAVTLLVTIVLTLISFYNSFLAFENFCELDNIIFTTRNYSQYGDDRSWYILISILFFFMGIFLSYMIIHHRGRIYDILYRTKRSK